MELDSAGVEFAFWEVLSDEDLTGTPEVRIGPTWHAAEWDGEQTVEGSDRRRTLRILLAGPLAPDTPGAVVVSRGRHRTAVRVPKLGENPVRDTEDLLVD